MNAPYEAKISIAQGMSGSIEVLLASEIPVLSLTVCRCNAADEIADTVRRMVAASMERHASA